MIHPRTLLERYGLHASKARGQNFLNSSATALAIARQVAPPPDGVVLEIGGGLGALTLALASLAGRVVVLEVDRGVHQALTEILAQEGVENVDLRLADALTADWAGLAAEAGGPLTLAGNLPYNLTSPLLFNLLEARRHWTRGVFMVQREVAQRLAARPGGKEWGRLAVLTQAFCQVTAGSLIGRKQFYPEPQVESRLVHLTVLAEPRGGLTPDQEAWFRQVVKAAFAQRRKMVGNSLAAGLELPRAAVDQALAGVELLPTRRAETMSVEELAAAARALAPLIS
ncbi:MAG: 16S rRNA (adenine(1518)-N(6)/adenine(1519)-N(6))-dimethyltransferase RsmA [Deltaproteobacteria bacterium]|nr:16S rRNA (adenine(1518)-N(6)/adenine(1519)-N(6))-dimethyltransferase RsmA [Deltaproteobacteria bacterium]